MPESPKGPGQKQAVRKVPGGAPGTAKNSQKKPRGQNFKEKRKI